MNPSDRVKIIREATKLLSQEEWGIIDLTLEQLNFPTSEDYAHSKTDYVLEHIKNENANKLADLATHLDIIIGSEESEIKPTFWKDGYTRLFICHITTDKETAQELKNNLEKYSITGFVAHSDIEPTKEWQDEIELSLKTCDSLVALMIKDFHKSEWCDQEIGVALGKDLFIMSVKMGQDPYGFIGKFQAIPFSDVETLAKDIFEYLAKNKKTSKKIAYSMMYRFENSDSFAEAGTNFGSLQKVEYWDDKLIIRLKTAVDNNSQISSAWNMSEKVSALVDKLVGK